MNQIRIFMCLVLVLLLSASLTAGDKPGYQNAELDIEDRVQDLVERMTLEEKIGQMKQVFFMTDFKELEKMAEAGDMGSVLGSRTDMFSVKQLNALQKTAVKKSRLGIPLLYGLDVIHGYKTIFPLNIAQSCTWSPEIIEEGAAIAAAEADAAGIHWTFAPMVDVSRDARWGRIAECYGEDTYLNSVLGAAAVRGFQGEDYGAPGRVAACMKHFVGYGASEGGRDYQYTEISERTLRETYLPPFKAGIEAGAPTLMSAFNDISGVPASANRFTLTDVLRGEWGFDGFILSDWASVGQLIPHGFAADDAEAGRRAVEAGVDMEMVTTTYNTLIEQVQSGKVSENVIDTAVERILRIKFRMGLFENPYTDEKGEKNAYLQSVSREAARRAAAASMVLLKNENNVLPIKNDSKSIVVAGPYAESQDLIGWWRCLGEEKQVVTALKGLQDNAPDGLQITQEFKGQNDALILCVGEEHSLFGEYNGRSDIKLPHGQEALIKEYSSKNIPVVLVIFNGRPLDLSNVLPLVDAIVIAWHPGTEAGNALADVIYGKTNPGAKLTATFPASVGQIPVYYNRRKSGRPEQERYVFSDHKPLFPFGYGLSYTTFEYSNLSLSETSIKSDGTLTVSATVKNTGDREGQEVVQLYIQDVTGSVTRPIKELKGFEKIKLAAGESKEVEFEMGFEQLSMLNLDFERVVEPGQFKVWVAPNSLEGLMGEFEVIE